VNTTTATAAHENTDLPAFPGTRSTRCPLDPPAEQAGWLRDDGPRRALWRGTPVWVVSRYADIRQALADPRLSADDRTPGFPAPSANDPQIPQSFIRTDDPEHARLRRMLTGEFTVKRMEQLRPRIQELVDRCLDQMTAQGRSADLVHCYALPIPSAVISLLLGVAELPVAW
jgi:cytochrome P450